MEAWPRCPVPARFRPAFEAASAATRLPVAPLTAVAHVESQCEPTAVSPVGARGLFQVMPSTAEELNHDASTRTANIVAGARYVRMLLDQFGPTELALAAYKPGPTAVAQANDIPNRTSRAYVHEVERIWRAYNGCR